MSCGLLALVAILIALTACGGAFAATPCWKQVQNDWTDNKTIDKTYPAACYDKAVKKLPTDLFYYSDAPDTIQAAKEDMLRANARKLTAHQSDPQSGPSASSGKKSGGDSPLGAILNWGPSAADDVPLPLLVIAFLALLLMGAGAAGLLNRRLHERRAGGPPEGPSAA